MGCEMTIEEQCMVAWIPFNNSFTPVTYGPRGKWTGVLFQIGRYRSTSGDDTPGLDSIEVLDSTGAPQKLPEDWDWINIVSTDMLGTGEPMARTHLTEICGNTHGFHQHFTPDEPARTITYWQGALGYTVTAGPSEHGSSRFTFGFNYPVRIDVYSRGGTWPAVTFDPGQVKSITLRIAEVLPETHGTNQEPPG